MSLRPGDDLNEAVRLYCEAREMSVARLSTIILNDGKTLTRMANDGARRLTLLSYNKAMDWLWDNWPADLADKWPASRDVFGTGVLGYAEEIKAPKGQKTAEAA